MNKLHPVFFPLTTSILFGLAIFTGVISREGWDTKNEESMSFFAKFLLAAGFMLLAAWFLHAFTRPDRAGEPECQADQSASMFRFAYMFAIFSFAMLVLPFTAMLRTYESTPDAGPIRMLRACVEVQPGSRPASGSTPGALDLCPDPVLPGTISYPWLVSVGGVVARQCGTEDLRCSNTVAAAASAASAVHAAASAASAPAAEKKPPLYRVHGGFIVPFYVVVFAFVGGVVNLTRRVPEYQKRSSCNFAGTATESRVTLLEAREFVVFQIMQLVSSPFIAMVAYHALEPKSVASAVGIAFFSGFATESVLLLLRGMFAGLQPTTTKTTASAPATAQLHVLVKHAGQPAEKARVELRRMPNEQPPLKADMTNARGEVEFKALPPGTVWVVATLDNPGAQPSTLKAAQKAQIKAGETESVELTLA